MEDHPHLLVELVHAHTVHAPTRLMLQHRIAQSLSTLSSFPGERVLCSWSAVRATRRGVSRWQSYVRARRPRPRVASFFRRRLHTEDTPVLVFL